MLHYTQHILLINYDYKMIHVRVTKICLCLQLARMYIVI